MLTKGNTAVKVATTAQIVHSGQEGTCNLYSHGLINSDWRWLIPEKGT